MIPTNALLSASQDNFHSTVCRKLPLSRGTSNSKQKLRYSRQSAPISIWFSVRILPFLAQTAFWQLKTQKTDIWRLLARKYKKQLLFLWKKIIHLAPYSYKESVFDAGWPVAPLFDCDFSLLCRAALISKVLKTTSCQHSLEIMANQLPFDQKIDSISWVHEVKLAGGSRTEWIQVN